MAPGHLGTPWQRGEQPARPGFYIKLANGELVRHAGGALPGSRRDRYLRLHTIVVMALGPIAGLVYILLLPFLGLAMLAYALGQRTLRGLRTAGLALLAAVAFPAWLPGRSYLVRHQPRRQGGVRRATKVERDLADATRAFKEKRGRRG